MGGRDERGGMDQCRACVFFAGPDSLRRFFASSSPRPPFAGFLAPPPPLPLPLPFLAFGLVFSFMMASSGLSRASMWLLLLREPTRARVWLLLYRATDCDSATGTSYGYGRTRLTRL